MNFSCRTPSFRITRLLALAGLSLVSVCVTSSLAEAGTPGIDGAKTISAANTVVNGYSSLTSAVAGAKTFTVANIAALSPAGLTPLGAGSVILLYQANGATIDDTDTSTYGNITSYNNAGYYEFVTVGSVSGNTITLSSACNAISHTYTTSGSTGALEAEAVRVPQYSTLTIATGASITATPWSASEVNATGSASYGLSTAASGGIVAINVAGATTINGSINVTGDGFLGGDGYQDAGASSPVAPANHAQPITDTVFAGETGGDLSTALAGMKGEGIAGNQATLDLNFVSRYGRGAPANGGGGGNGHNGGGGGGSNGNNGNTWYGVGLLDTGYTAYYSNSNGKNPTGSYDAGGFSANGTPLPGTPMSIDSGGGRGGYSFGDPSAGIPPWNVGGYGGRPLTATANSRIFFGGGGGAGDENDGNGGYGGNGGGIVILNTGTLAGTGSIVANGGPGGTPNSSDGAGGGGGGGSVVVLAGSGSVATINANGGVGGNMTNGATQDSEGTGAGGGGGFVAAPATTITTAGGAEGILATTSAFGAFAPYGATLGTAGNGSATGPGSFTYCYTPVLGIAKAASTPVNNGDGTYNVTYTVVLENYGDTPLNTVGAQDVLANTFPTGTTYSIVTEPTTAVVTNGATATAGSNWDGTLNTYVINNTGTLPVSNPAAAATTSTITTTFTVKIKPPAGSQTYNNVATAGALGSTGNASGVVTTDSSQNGTNPDPAGNGNPGAENVPTPVTIVGQPLLMKNVQNVTTGEATGLTTDTAVPGNILKYTLSFTNNTGGPLTNYSIKDVIPTNTTYYPTAPAACAAFPAGMTCSAVYTPPAGATPGFVTFSLSGTATGQTTPGVPSTTTTTPAQLIFTFEVTVN